MAKKTEEKQEPQQAGTVKGCPMCKKGVLDSNDRCACGYRAAPLDAK